jgi:hypothetical protein
MDNEETISQLLARMLAMRDGWQRAAELHDQLAAVYGELAAVDPPQKQASELHREYAQKGWGIVAECDRGLEAHAKMN